MTVIGRAAEATRARPSLWVVALCGFLARGGIVILLLPVVPIPSTVGLATLVGPTSVTAAGLTADAALRLVLAIAAVVAWLLASGVIGAVTDVATVEALGRAEPSPEVEATLASDGRRQARRIVRLVALRLVALVPLGVVVAVTAQSVGELVYAELVLPSDISTPLVLRVVQGAQVQVAAIVIAWIVGEVLGGVAVRLAIVEDRSFGQALGGAIVRVVRHPLTALSATAAGLACLVVAIAPGLVLADVAWDALGRTLAGPIDGGAAVGWSVVLVVVLAAWASLVAILSAFRGAVWTAAVASSG